MSQPRNFCCVFRGFIEKRRSTAALQNGEREMRLSTRPRFGVRQCFAALRNGDQAVEPDIEIHSILSA